MLKVGIVGLPNVGKSSLFNALTAAGVPSANYPFCTVEPNVGIVEVPDGRLDTIHALTGSARKVPTSITFADIAGLVEGASVGEGLGNQFLAHIRGVDAIAMVLRCFDDPNVSHVRGEIDPLEERGLLEMELALADLELVERRMDRVAKKARSGESEAIREEAVLQALLEPLREGRSVRDLEFSPAELGLIRGFQLLTLKPVLHVANVSERELLEGGGDLAAELARAVADEGGEVVVVSAAIEAEVAELDDADGDAFLAELGLEGSGLDRLIQSAYRLLGLITFFTGNEREVHAWTIRQGVRAPQAAGAVHSDFERGFIRAETVSFEDLDRAGGLKSAREAGLVRSEGSEYVVRDGDLLLFRFNV